MSGDTSDIKIAAEPQMDPHVCRFVVDRPVYDGLITCKDTAVAEGSPLLENLMGIDGVREVMVAGKTITVAKRGDDGWQTIAKKIGTVIREVLASGGPVIDEEQMRKELPSNPELKKKVREIFDEEINPGLASHGGAVDLVDVKGTTLFVTLSGGCQGCASATYTLRNGIEQILRERIPEITEVVDVTDHGAGADPYYR